MEIKILCFSKKIRKSAVKVSSKMLKQKKTCIAKQPSVYKWTKTIFLKY